MQIKDEKTMQEDSEFNKAYADEQLRRSQHPLRRLIKYFYINNLLKDVKGVAVDVGCGAGQLLARLPQGSLGLELNPFLIDALTALGLKVKHYDMNEDDFTFSNIPDNQFSTLIIAHVLEHFTEAATVVRKIFRAAERLGFTRVIIVVPGKLGYASDKTHRTFINRAYITFNQLESVSGYDLTNYSYYPFPNEKFEKLFIYQELKLIYDKA